LNACSTIIQGGETMTRKKTDNVLALPPLRSDFGSTADTSLVPWSAREPLNRREKRMIEEVHRQDLAIDLEAQQARFGISMMRRIHEHGAVSFSEATEFLMDIKEDSDRSQEHQAYIDQYILRQVQLLAQQTLAVIDITTTNIGVEVHRPPYPPPQAPAGLLAWLLPRPE
jgi:hypothetical protein